MVPLGLMRPILLPIITFCWLNSTSVNQRLPSGPAVIPSGTLLEVGTGNSVMEPLGLIRPILLPFHSVNQRWPSGPAVIPIGQLLEVGTATRLGVLAPVVPSLNFQFQLLIVCQTGLQ